MQSDLNKLYTIKTDSSDFENDMTLYQEDDDEKLHFIAFDECKLHEAEL